LTHSPTVYFGGIGEPLAHHRTLDVDRAGQAIGRAGRADHQRHLADRATQPPLIDAGLDLLWVSIDGATPESYADVRLGAELPSVLANLQRFRTLRKGHKTSKPEIGIAFVAMKRNIADLPAVLKLARQLGALHFSVSNVLPVTENLQDEVLYNESMRSITYLRFAAHAASQPA
jgi:MoaA/NifB/PqqE/SkfB family radical SAM enzyme